MDDRQLLFMDDAHAMADGDIAIYRAPVDGSTPPVHFADGLPKYTTIDGGWLLISSGKRDRLSLVPLAAGQTIDVPLGDLREVSRAVTLRDNKTVIVTARRGSDPPRLYRIDPDGSPPKLVGPAGIRLPEVVQTTDLQSPDGKTLLVVDDAESIYRLLTLADGKVHPIPGFHPNWNTTWRTDTTLLVWIS